MKPRTAGLAALAGVLGAALAAQSAPHRPETALLIGAARSVPEAFNPCGERGAVLLTGRHSRPLKSRLFVDLTATFQSGIGSDVLDCGWLPPTSPPPPGVPGFSVREYYDDRIAGNPVHTGARLTWALVQSRQEQLRISAGMERAWKQRLWVPVLGISDVMGRGRFGLMLDFEMAWYSLTRHRTRTDFLDGVITGSTTTDTTIKNRSARGRIGVVIRNR